VLGRVFAAAPGYVDLPRAEQPPKLANGQQVKYVAMQHGFGIALRDKKGSKTVTQDTKQHRHTKTHAKQGMSAACTAPSCLRRGRLTSE
jgi:hypothetical protein